MRRINQFIPKRWKEVKRSNDKVLMEREDGKTRVVQVDKKGIKNGDYLQPVGKSKDAFVKKYGYLPGESKNAVEKYLKRRGLGKTFDPNHPGLPENEEWRPENKGTN